MTNLLIVFFLLFSLSAGTKISSKIDLDSDEQCPDLPTINSDPVIVVVKNEPDVRKGTRGSWPSGSRSHHGNVNFRDREKSIRTQNNHNPTSNQPTVLNNIYIFVNGNEISSMPNAVNCKNNVCETTVTINTNEEGNKIGSVTVLTKTKSINVEDVPVINGIRASGYDDRRDTPTFVPNNVPAYPRPHYIGNVVPQRQAPRRNPPGSSFYPRNFEPRKKPTAWNSWTPGRTPVDDKIDLPFSQTNRFAQ